MLSPLSLASIVTLSGSHVFPGEIVAMSGLGSAPAVAMMVAGRWDPTLAALRDTDSMRAPGWAPAHSRCHPTFGFFSEPPDDGGRHVALDPLCCGEDEHSTAVLSGALLPYPSTTAPAHPPYPSLRIDPAQPHLNSRP